MALTISTALDHFYENTHLFYGNGFYDDKTINDIECVIMYVIEHCNLKDNEFEHTRLVNGEYTHDGCLTFTVFSATSKKDALIQFVHQFKPCSLFLSELFIVVDEYAYMYYEELEEKRKQCNEKSGMFPDEVNFDFFHDYFTIDDIYLLFSNASFIDKLASRLYTSCKMKIIDADYSDWM